MNNLISAYGFSDAQMNQPRVEAGRSEDAISDERNKLFNLGKYQVRVTAHNREVANVEIAA